MQRKNSQPRDAPPVAHQDRRLSGACTALLLGTVVLTVNVALAKLPVRFTGLVLPKLSVGKSCALGGDDAITAVRTTLPVNPPVGPRVMMVVVRLWPCLTLIAPPVMVNPGSGAEVAGVNPL